VLSSEFDAVWQEQDKVLDTLYSGGLLAALDMSTQEAIPVWRYYGSMDGTFRLYPGAKVAQQYDPIDRPWFSRALTDAQSNPDKTPATFISTPYLDAFGMGYIITVSRAVRYKGNEEIAGVFGTDYYLKQLGNMFDDVTGYSTTTQLLVDSTGSIIWWDAWHKEPELVNIFDKTDGVIALTLDDISNPVQSGRNKISVAKSLVMGGMPTLYCHDPLNLFTRRSLDLEGFMGTEEAKTITNGNIKTVTGTNAFIVKLDFSAEIMTVNRTQFPTVDPEVESNVTETIDFDGFHEMAGASGFFVGHLERSRSYSSNVFLPDALKYDTCENRFLDVDTIPACYPLATALLDYEYLGDMTYLADGSVAFANESTEGLEECFVFMGQWSEYALYPTPLQEQSNNTIIIIFLIIILGCVVVLVAKMKFNLFTKVTSEEEEEKKHPKKAPVTKPLKFDKKKGQFVLEL